MGGGHSSNRTTDNLQVCPLKTKEGDILPL